MLICRGGGGGGGGVSCPGQFIFPPTHLGIKVKLCAYTTYLKLSECEDVSIINIIQVKFSFYLCQIVLYA